MACVYRVPHFVQSAVALVHSYATLRGVHISMMQVQMRSNQVVTLHFMGLAAWISLKVGKSLRPCPDVGTCVPGCVQKNTSDASKSFCVPAGVTGIPPLSSATIEKYNSCDAKRKGPGCRAAQNWVDAGTGCLDECKKQTALETERTDNFCKNQDFWTCPGTPAPCSGALPAGSAPVGAVNPSSAPSEAPGSKAGAACSMLVV
jgi:hypothetical protein